MNIISKTPHLRKAALMLSLLIGLTPKLEAKLYDKVVPPTREAAGLIERTLEEDTLKKSIVEYKGGQETDKKQESHGTESQKGHHEAGENKNDHGTNAKHTTHLEVGASVIRKNNDEVTGGGLSVGLAKEVNKNLMVSTEVTAAKVTGGYKVTAFGGIGNENIGFGGVVGLGFHHGQTSEIVGGGIYLNSGVFNSHDKIIFQTEVLKDLHTGAISTTLGAKIPINFSHN